MNTSASQVTECRSDKVDSTTGEMDILNKLPRWLGKAAVQFIMWLDKHGWVPDSMTCNGPLLQLCGACPTWAPSSSSAAITT
ncbi:MAG: hypothetical protein ACLSHM_09355 [Vescimonas sp.]